MELQGKLGALYTQYKNKDQHKLIKNIESSNSYSANGFFDLGTFDFYTKSNDDDYILIVVNVNIKHVKELNISFSHMGHGYKKTVLRIPSGLNYIKIIKSSFDIVGNPSWSSIDNITINAAGVTFKALFLLSKTKEIAIVNDSYVVLEDVCVFYNWEANDIDKWSLTAEQYFTTNEAINKTLFATLYFNPVSGRRYDSLCEAHIEHSGELKDGLSIRGKQELTKSNLKIYN